MASGPAIAARAIQAVSIGASTLIQTLTEGNYSLIDAKVVAEAARQGDKLATDILMDAGRYIGIGVAMVANLLSPEMVIIGGGVAQSGEFFIDIIRSTVYQRAYTIIVNRLFHLSSRKTPALWVRQLLLYSKRLVRLLWSEYSYLILCERNT
jgi:predicted NBD/HSP70 family sugar kinase